MDDLNYLLDVEIDATALDIEWLEQTRLAIRYARNAAYKNKVAKRWAERVKVLQAELTKKANKNPVKYCHKEKPNLEDIRAYYQTHPRYREAMKEKIEADYQAEYAELAKWEICKSRKDALENLVILHGQMYFAGPHVPRNITKEWEKRRKDKIANQRVAEKFKKGKVQEASDE